MSSTLLSMEDAMDMVGIVPGRDSKTHCPDHIDKTPSLHLYDDHWYCFACGKSGDGVGLVALFFKKPVNQVYAQFANKTEDLQGRTDATKGLRRRNVRTSVTRQYQEVTAWFFHELHALLEDRPAGMLYSHVDYWSNRVEDAKDDIYDEELSVFEADDRVRTLRLDLEDALRDIAEVASWKGPVG